VKSDQKPEERVWYAHRTTGERAYLVLRDGREWMHLDRPTEALRAFTGDWVRDTEFRPIAIGQLAQVAYVAHQELCRVVGDHGQTQKAWVALSDAERRPWLDGTGPAEPKEARLLFKVIWKVLSTVSR
jgi:hypothetical protein